MFKIHWSKRSLLDHIKPLFHKNLFLCSASGLHPSAQMLLSVSGLTGQCDLSPNSSHETSELRLSWPRVWQETVNTSLFFSLSLRNLNLPVAWFLAHLRRISFYPFAAPLPDPDPQSVSPLLVFWPELWLFRAFSLCVLKWVILHSTARSCTVTGWFNVSSYCNKPD